MNKFFKLLKVDLAAILYGFNFYQRKKFNRPKAYSLLIITAIIVFIQIYFGYLAYTVTSALHQYNLEWMVLALSFIICMLFTLTTGVTTTGNILISGRDIQGLLAYPLKTWQIMLSKITALMIENWLINFFVLLPFCAIYYYFVQPGIIFLLYFILAFLFLHFIPFILSAIMALVVNALSFGARFKNLFKISFSIAATLLLVMIPQVLLANYEKIIANSNDILHSLKIIIPPAGFLIDAIINNNFMSLLIYILISVLPFIIYILATSKYIRQLWIKNNNTKKANNNKIGFTINSQFTALLKKDMGRYFSSYIYVLNTGIGMVLMTVLTGFIIFNGKDVIIEVMKTTADVSTYIPTMVIIIYSFMIGMSCTTAPSISIEGKNFWIVKSFPVSVKKVFLSKIVNNMVITIPLLLINSIIVTIALKFSFLEGIALFIIPLLLTIIIAAIGLISNIYLPRLDALNDMLAVKSSPSVLIAILAAFLMVGLIAVGLIGLSFISTALVYLIITVVLIAIAAVLYRFLFTKGIKIYEKI